jgi:LAO/AO transport system kinase
MTPFTLDLAQGIVEGRRESLARAITLIESTREDHKQQAALLLNYLANVKAEAFHDHLARKKENSGSTESIESNLTINNSGYTLRLGIAGPPGAGKSTFIEALGMKFIDKGFKVAVVPVDPSSHISGGSILGDKTRMEQLSRSDRAYVRASPTKGVLGGIAEHTADVISLCESCR